MMYDLIDFLRKLKPTFAESTNALQNRQQNDRTQPPNLTCGSSDVTWRHRLDFGGNFNLVLPLLH
jgi:hypothetical protein